MRTAVILLAAACACLPPSAEHPQAGAACTGSDYACLDGETLLACEHGAFVPYTCRGPNGCTQQGRMFSCDETVARDGEACPSQQEGAFACDEGGKLKLQCVDGMFVRRGSCPGCHLAGNEIACSPSAGDGCEAPEFGCADPKTALECLGNVFVRAPCRGPGGCWTSGRTLFCDATLATPAEPCLSTREGQHACSTQGHHRLVCQDGRWEVAAICVNCSLTDGRLSCAR